VHGTARCRSCEIQLPDYRPGASPYCDQCPPLPGMEKGPGANTAPGPIEGTACRPAATDTRIVPEGASSVNAAGAPDGGLTRIIEANKLCGQGLLRD
jgi:hypothetical protein